MANKAHGTRQKLVFRVERPKPRNPFAVRARQLKGGQHGPGAGGVRLRAKRQLKKLIDEE
jgi:hypothetical protein